MTGAYVQGYTYALSHSCTLVCAHGIHMAYITLLHYSYRITLTTNNTQVRRPNNYDPNAALMLGPPDPNPTMDLSELRIVRTVVLDSPNKLFVGGVPCEWTEEQVWGLWVGVCGWGSGVHADGGCVFSRCVECMSLFLHNHAQSYPIIHNHTLCRYIVDTVHACIHILYIRIMHVYRSRSCSCHMGHCVHSIL